MVRIFGHDANAVIHAGGAQYTPNDFVDSLNQADFNPAYELDLALKLAGVVAAFECWDELDARHQRQLLKVGLYAYIQGSKVEELT